MTCEDFETLLADALGDELSSNDRQAFESHLADCAKCRREYETSHRAVETMQLLTGPRQVRIERQGGRLVIQTPEPTGSFPGNVRRKLKPAARLGGLLRLAASLLIAFTAGYGVHAGLMMADATRRAGTTMSRAAAPPRSLRGSLVSAHARNPTRSGLAKCLAAISQRSP